MTDKHVMPKLRCMYLIWLTLPHPPIKGCMIECHASIWDFTQSMFAVSKRMYIYCKKELSFQLAICYLCPGMATCLMQFHAKVNVAKHSECKTITVVTSMFIASKLSVTKVTCITC